MNDEEKPTNISTSFQYADSSALQMRLDMSEVLTSVRTSLSGELRTYTPNTDGGVSVIKEKLGPPLVNKRGLRSIMQRLQLIFNTGVVQGNWTLTQYQTNIAQLRRSITDDAIINRDAWELNKNEFNTLIDSIMLAAKGFLSRLIDNKERESYGSNSKIIDNQAPQKKSFFG